jgi:putative heme-binding domain-containing protein
MRFTLFLLLTVAVTAVAQHGSTTRSNPFNSPEDQEEGARLFRVQCSACHGQNGTGGAGGPALTAALRRGESDEAIYGAIVKGIPGTPMPAYPGAGRDAWQITAYLQSLRVGKAAAPAKGDPRKGARIFANQQCAMCHEIDGTGSSMGPELSRIGAMRTPGLLQRAITHPNEEVSQDYWMVRGLTKKGELVSGIRLNEDTHSIQYREAQRLRSVLKEDLAQIEIVRTSPMPSFAEKISAVDLENLVAYLSSLRGQQ